MEAAVAVVVGAAVVAVALVFDAGVPDAFALPKAGVVRWLAVAAAVPALSIVATGGLTVHRAVDVSVAAFASLNLVAFALSSDVGQSFSGERLQYQGLASILAYAGFFYLARMSLGSMRRIVGLLVAVAATGAVVAGYAIAQRAGVDPIWGEIGRERVFSTIGQPNALAAFLVVVIPIGVGLVRWGGRLPRATGGLATLLAVPALAWTFSRGGYAGLTAAAAVLGVPAFASAMARRRRAILTVACAGLLVVAAVAHPFARTEAGRVVARAASGFDVDSWERVQRIALWKVGWRIATDHPLTGTGQETFPELFPHYRERVLSPAEAATLASFRPESPHNVYLAIAGGAGFPALGAYLAVLGSWFGLLTGAYRRESDERLRAVLLSLLAAVAGHTVTDFFMTAESAGSLTSWVLMGAGTALVALNGPRPDLPEGVPPLRRRSRRRLR